MNEFIKYQPQNNIAYILNPKVACTSIQNSLLFGEVKKVHNKNNFPPYNNPSVPLFTVVRNPFDRAVSAYLDKVVSQKDPIVWRNFVEKLGKEVDYNIGFEEYLDILLEHPNLARADKHFRPQVHNLHGVTPSFIGYIEDMGEVERYLNMCGIKIINKMPHKTDTKNKKKILLEAESVIEKLKALYQEDFDSFGYSLEPKDNFNLLPKVQKQIVPEEVISTHLNIVDANLVDVFRNASLICEKEDKKLALELITLALKIRPKGPLINKVYERLKKS